MAQPVGGRFIFGGRGRKIWRNQLEAVLCSAAEGAIYGATRRRQFYFSAAESATFGATNRRQFYILGGRGRNIWRHQQEALSLSAAEGATYGATNGRRAYSRRPKAQAMAQPIGSRFILGGRARKLWRNQ